MTNNQKFFDALGKNLLIIFICGSEHVSSQLTFDRIDEMSQGSIFQDFNLPNAATWFYFSLLLAIALFFKFSRLLSVRSWDVVAVFILVPGFLLLGEAQNRAWAFDSRSAAHTGRIIAASAAAAQAGAFDSAGATIALASQLPVNPSAGTWVAFLWLLCGSVYFFVRCMLDLALTQRPALSPNLNFAGLAWLGCALFVCLTAVAVRKPESNHSPIVGKQSVAVKETHRRAEGLMRQGLQLEPENSASFLAERTLAMICHFAIVLGLISIGYRHFQDATAGMAAATFYLLLPYTAFHVEQIHHVWPTAMIIWAIASYRHPTLAGILLGIATGTVYFPLLLYPLWLSFYWKRGAGRFTLGFGLGAAVSLGIVATLLFVEGDLDKTLANALSLSDWQPWRHPSPETKGVWTTVAWAWVYRLPVFVAYIAFVAATLFWPSPKNLAHLIALSAAVLIGIQLWYADQGGVYVLWYMPLVLLLVFRPNLSDRRAIPIDSETDWLARAMRTAHRIFLRLLRMPEATVPVS